MAYSGDDHIQQICNSLVQTNLNTVISTVPYISHCVQPRRRRLPYVSCLALLVRLFFPRYLFWYPTVLPRCLLFQPPSLTLSSPPFRRTKCVWRHEILTGENSLMANFNITWVPYSDAIFIAHYSAHTHLLTHPLLEPILCNHEDSRFLKINIISERKSVWQRKFFLHFLPHRFVAMISYNPLSCIHPTGDKESDIQGRRDANERE